MTINKNNIAQFIVVIVVLMLYLPIQTISTPSTSPKTIYVSKDFADDPANHRWNSIQEGVDYAKSGDTVYVYNGTYYEDVVVNKPINLTGEDTSATIIDARLVAIKVNNNLSVSGFTIKNGTYGIELGTYGIELESIASTIFNNIFINIRGTAIVVWSPNAYPIIVNNQFTNNFHGGISIPSSGVISNNIFTNNGDGIFLEGGGADICIFSFAGSSPEITNNTIRNNNAYGIVTFRSSPRITDNIISGNAIGIWDWKDSSLTIFNNTISDNQWGIYLSHSINSNITDNNIILNKNSGIYLLSSSNNRIYHNNLINNMPNAYDDSSSNSWDSGYTSGGNYWSDFAGADTNNDGIGDTPFNINGGAGAMDSYPFMLQNGWVSAIPITTPSPTTPTPSVPPTTVPPTPAVKQPLLTVSQTSLKEEPEVGEEVLITVSIQNVGEGIAKNIRLTEQLPSSISVSFIDGAISNTPNLVMWNGELAPNRAHAIIHSLKILEKKSRAIPVIIRYEDEAGNPKEASTTIYVEAQVPATPTPTPYSTPRVTGFNSLLVLIGLMVAILLVRRR